MASPTFDQTQFQTPIKKCPISSSPSSPSSISTTSTDPKQRSITGSSSNNTNDETITTIKMEDGTDEIKIFSASTIKKNDPDDDIDVDGIEDRLSPVIETPTSPDKNDPLHSSISGLYTSPFLYPYFHPMFHPYLMAAAAQANAAGSSTDKSSDGQNLLTSNPYGGAPSPFSGFNPGMPFPSLYPPGMGNQSFRPNLFNPFGIPIPAPGVRPPQAPSASSSSSSSSNRHHQNYDGSPRNLSVLLDAQRPKKPHIKKPLNAFMLYMKEQRARVIEECTLKESSAINKVLGQKWKELPRAEQDRYYELAKEERNRHMQLYPGWSARDNYGLKKKRQSSGHTPVLNNSHKKAPRENNSMVNSPGHLNHGSPHRYGQQHHLINSPHMNSNKNPIQLENDCLNQKKCRARFGLEGQSQWCKHCRRKKKCTRFLEEDMSNHANNNNMNNYHNPSMNTHGRNNGNPSLINSPRTNQSDDDDDDDSVNEPDGDDILSRQVDTIEDDDDEDEDDDEDDSDEENKQQHHHQQPVSLVYKPIPSKIDSHQHQFQPPPPAHLYQPSTLPSHFTPNFHY
ncbi:unnamed protein product [Adineta steineri]|uniref:HMG box domain-containing protein n=1 Tax=Adineta steineri TaxID=433720 RepID=A0A815QG79_9BILA|nr:unnamed protein product [Adineta steineri]CAF3821198.1 unnamed protein product [Adineta steineri]